MKLTSIGAFFAGIGTCIAIPHIWTLLMFNVPVLNADLAGGTSTFLSGEAIIFTGLWALSIWILIGFGAIAVELLLYRSMKATIALVRTSLASRKKKAQTTKVKATKRVRTEKKPVIPKPTQLKNPTASKQPGKQDDIKPQAPRKDAKHESHKPETSLGQALPTLKPEPLPETPVII